MNKNYCSDYDGCRLIDIKRGTGGRECYIYAHLVDKNDSLLISATLDYILKVLPERVSKEHFNSILGAVTDKQAELLKEAQRKLAAESYAV